jgi:hypothetical protein
MVRTRRRINSEFVDRGALIYTCNTDALNAAALEKCLRKTALAPCVRESFSETDGDLAAYRGLKTLDDFNPQALKSVRRLRFRGYHYPFRPCPQPPGKAGVACSRAANFCVTVVENLPQGSLEWATDETCCSLLRLSERHC